MRFWTKPQSIRPLRGLGGWDQYDAIETVKPGHFVARRGADLVLYIDTDGNNTIDLGGPNNVIGD